MCRELSAFGAQLASTEDREISTTMAFVRILNTLLRDKTIGKFVVPIVPDESRTFGMEGMFRQFGIFSQVGQLYKPQDADQLMYYREDRSGQMLQEGINEAGAMSSWIAAATSYSTSNVPMIPFYIYYSMFGLQRVGDLAWAAGDMRARGFLLGGTAGRTTLNGEGLQHEDGHSHLLAATIPNCVAYDPTFAYEVAVIIQDGLRRMMKEQEDVYYYITLMNENYPHPAMPAGAEDGIRRGMYLFRETYTRKGRRGVQLLGSGTILREVIAAADLLEHDFGVAADIWSCPSFNELRRDGMEAERWNLLHPTQAPRKSYVEECLAGRQGPGHRCDRLHAGIRGTDSTLCAEALCLPGHGWFRPQRLSQGVAKILRGRSALCRGGRAQGAGRRRRAEGAEGGRRDRQVRHRCRARAALESLRSEQSAARRDAGQESVVGDARVMGEIRQVTVPDIGDFKDVPIIEIAVKVGDRVKAEEPLITLESDKASMEVPSPSAGVVKSLAVKIGDKVSQGAPILTLEVDDAGAADQPVKPAVTPPPAPTSAPSGVAEVRVPDIGDFKDVPIIEIAVKPGDTVKPEQPLITLESDKASMEVPSPFGGMVAELKVKIGDRVSEGAVILTLTHGSRGARRHSNRSPHRRLPRPGPPPRRRLRLVSARPPRPRPMRRSTSPTQDLRCASSRASAASICIRSRAADGADEFSPRMS